MKQTLLVLGGALAGGVLGYFACYWLATQGIYAMVVPGGLLGLGAGIGKNRSTLLAVLCGLAATALGLFTEWHLAPFIRDHGLGYFLAHAHQLQPSTLMMIGLGGLISFWVLFRRRERMKDFGGRSDLANDT